eukprot:1202861-Amphidinium_carterae.1
MIAGSLKVIFAQVDGPNLSQSCVQHNARNLRPAPPAESIPALFIESLQTEAIVPPQSVCLEMDHGP